ncbi:MAG: hypothetical protein P1V36_09940 [Planctomycetota bacterium]|nr:hypothetical protein [Planctomycetota bacterium]
MKASFLVLAACGVALLATASPALAENRSDLRRAVQAADAVPSAERLARYEAPRWAEIASQAQPAPCGAPVCDPCCLPYDYPCGNPCTWHGEVSLLAWIPGIDGDMTVRGRKADVKVKPMDIIENLDKLESIFQGRISAYRGKWGFTLGGLTVRFEDTLDIEETGTTRTGGIGLDMLEAYVSYCLKRCPLEVGCNPRCPGFAAYEVYVGARYFSTQLTIDPLAGAAAVAAGARQVKSWVDPIIGGKATWELGNGWGFDLQGDIGGFGVGSDFSWNLRAGVQYRPWQLASFELGFKITQMDYTDGSGTNRFEWDAALWGPYLALNFHF